METVLKKRRFFSLFVFACLGLLAWRAHAVPIGEQILNGDFGTDAAPSLANWTIVGGAGVNARASNNAINTNTGSGASRFNNHFTSAFAVLGDNMRLIGGTPTVGTDMIFQSFVLPATQGGQAVGSYDLLIDFRTAFDGADTAPTPTDMFSVILFLPDGSVMTLVSEASDTPMTQRNNDFIDFPVSVPCLGLGTCDGTYTLQFQLVEATGGRTNTAAGIDQVSITGEANLRLVIVPESSTIFLFISGVMMLLPLVQHRRVRRFFKD